MKKDIELPVVEGVYVAIVKADNEAGEVEWNVLLVNSNAEPIHTVFVTSKGYSSKEDPKGSLQTSTLRHFFKEIDSERYVRVEPVVPEVFGLFNEYWVSYYLGNKLFDKKFIFVPDSISEAHLIEIPMLGVQGVVHK